MTKGGILLTCPPMLGMAETFRPAFEARGYELFCPKIVQTLSEGELIELVPKFDGWIAGDDPATERVLESGVRGRLRALVKWGIGVDSIDLRSIERLKLRFSNTPAMFGSEVADMAVGYLICLMRSIPLIHQGVQRGEWPKIRGSSLSGKKAALIGFGDIGRNIAKRLLAMEMHIFAFDPFVESTKDSGIELAPLEVVLKDADAIILACPLNSSNRHILNERTLRLARRGVRVVNVARGPLIDEKSLVALLREGHVSSAALDVFEDEPLPQQSELRGFASCVFGSHNASNTEEAVVRASREAMRIVFEFLEQK